MEFAQPIDPTQPVLPQRVGERAITTAPNRQHAYPHQQVTQNAPVELQDELSARAATLAGVTLSNSCVSVPGARALHLDPELAKGPEGAFQCRTEFAHIHPPGDGSLHMTLPDPVKAAAIEQGWGEPHPISGTMLIFGPRDRRELETVWQLILASYRYALGDRAA